MTMQENAKNSFAELFDDLKKYVSLQLENSKLTLFEKISFLTGKLILVVVILFFCLVITLLSVLLIYNLLMMWIGIGWLVSLIELAFFALLLGLTWLFRNAFIIRPVSNMIIRTLYDDDDDDDDDNDE